MRSITNGQTLFAALIFLACAGWVHSPPDPPGDTPAPNIIIIVTDDLGWGDVGYHGSEIRTPNIDRLAREGVRLNRFYAAPVCSPTRAGLLTGRYPHRFGIMRAVVWPWSTHGLPPAEKTLPEMLAEAGYEHRGIVGKWHLGNAYRKHHPLNQGFTHFYGHYTGALDYFTHRREGELDWHRDFEVNRDEGYITDLVAEEAARFVRQRDKESPFFLYVAFNAPHTPLQAKEEDLAQYPGLRGKRKKYAAMVDALDQGVGEVLGALEQQGIADNTLVLFVNDNGGRLASRATNDPLRAGKATVYEGGIRVPAIVRWPGGDLRGGREVDELMGYIDVYPTLKRIVGHTAPNPRPVDGLNVLDVVREGAAAPVRDWFSFLALEEEGVQSALTSWPWKLIVKEDGALDTAFAADAEMELYRLDRDPYEKNDLAPEHPQRVAELFERLRAFRAHRVPGVAPRSVGREGFVPPENWQLQDNPSHNPSRD